MASDPQIGPSQNRDAPVSRILVVEDEAGVRQVLQKLLGAQGHDVVLAADAEGASQALGPGGFDLVIIDKNLPQMSGMDLLSEIKGDDPDVDVIIMTAFPDMASVIEAMKGGAYDYLVKPFDTLETVLHVVERALEKRRIKLENRRLIKDLVEANDRVTALNRQLEDKVAERTRQLEELTLTDDTTGLYNQRFLYRRLHEECSRANRYGRHLSVAMLDIDDFKLVNDTHDHLFGSRALKRVGEILRSCVRTADAVVRYGGDEFTLILPETAPGAAAIVCERVREKIQASNVGEAHDPYQITVSIGLASLEVSGTAEALLRAADHATYEAKAGGKNRVAIARPRSPLTGEETSNS
jgi:diguanylate cyclase (GGDEF)-like protein